MQKPVRGSCLLAGAVALAAAFAMCAGCAQEPPEPPVAAAIAHADTNFGDVRIDDYYWMRERENPEVIAYLEAENAYTEAMMRHTERLQETLYEEMVARLKETDEEVPYRKGDYFYYTRTEEGKQYSIYCRKKGSLDAEEEVILDQNVLADGLDFFELGNFVVSPDHTLLAYSTDTTGAEEFTLHVKDLATGELLPDTIENVDYDLAWANDNNTLFYTTFDDAKRTDKLWRHVLGTEPRADVLVHHQLDPPLWVSISRTLSDAYLVLTLSDIESSEERILEADDPTGEFRLVAALEDGVEYYLGHSGEHFYIRTNLDANNYRIVRAPVWAPSRERWETMIPHRDDVKIERFSTYARHLVLHERYRGLRRIRIIDLETGDDHYVDFPEPVYAVWGGDNKVFDTNVYRYVYMSYVTPRSTFDYDIDVREAELLKQREVLGGYDASLYKTERIFATAEDGTEVPISLVYRTDALDGGPAALKLSGYGAYGSSMDPWFSSRRLSILDRGVVFAMAHVRGGGEMGEEWYDDGKLLNKMNTFTDFIACAEHLIAEGYTTSDLLAMSGGSAGGLLVGAVVNMRPDLFAVAMASVPFVDAVTTMLDETIPLTVNEYDEWGNPNEEEYYFYMKSYSPYDNVAAVPYPDILITASLNDQRVQYWEPAKWTAKLRATKTGDGVLLLKMNMGAGHGGSSGRYDWMKEIAFEYAFMLDRLGVGG
jgi:oligopeptidase B